MTKIQDLSPESRAKVRDLLKFYAANRHQAELAAKSILALYESSSDLISLTHSVKWRAKSLESMERKLVSKAKAATDAGLELDISTDSFFDKITDCAGFRILHLHTSQFGQIHSILEDLFRDRSYKEYEPPFARVWDVEYRKYFEGLGLEVQTSPSYYTSVHYVVDLNSQSGCKCEIQVRSLAEEIWGEVDHSINYPDNVDFVPCEEQIRALARLTSSCTRLVDSIYKSYECKPQRRGASSRQRTS